MENERYWHKIGNLKSGEAIYCGVKEEIAIEKEHHYLVAPNEEEMLELKGEKIRKIIEIG